jgi:hypothetical protein
LRLDEGLSNGDDNDADDVAGDSEHEHERQDGAPRQDEFEHVIRDRNIDGARHRPCLYEQRFVLDGDVHKVGRCGAGDASGRPNQRQAPAAPRVQRPSGHHGLDNLLPDEREEERHADFVDHEGERLRQPEVALPRDVGPHERNRGPDRQQQEVVAGEREQADGGPRSTMVEHDPLV